jgi:hypothetical protein
MLIEVGLEIGNILSEEANTLDEVSLEVRLSGL